MKGLGFWKTLMGAAGAELALVKQCEVEPSQEETSLCTDTICPGVLLNRFIARV